MQHTGTVAIVGVGLIGGSIGRAIKSRELATKVVGIGRRETSLAAAMAAGAIDEAATDFKAVSNADVVIVCTPVGMIAGQVIEILKLISPECVVTDAGSAKSEIVAEIEAHFSVPRDSNRLISSPCSRFVGSHPLAGGEKNGPEFSDPDLFVGRQVIVTPTQHSDPVVTRRLDQFWQALGATTIQMSPDEHDKVVAAVSHLPHLVAAALAAASPSEFLPLASTGWSDTTRIASGDTELWLQIFQQNREGTLKSLGKFETVLAQFRKALESNDLVRLEELLKAGKKNRDIVAN